MCKEEGKKKINDKYVNEYEFGFVLKMRRKIC